MRKMKLCGKNIIKRFNGLLLAAALVCSMTACGGEDKDVPANAVVESQPATTDAQGATGESGQNTENQDITGETEPATEDVAVKQPEIDIIMVGDVLLHDRVEECAVQEDGSYNFDAIFANVASDIQAADLAIVNQEVIIGGEDLGVSGYPCFNAPYAIGDALVNAGFDVVCHGTNHALDKGKSGLLNCIKYWKENHPQMAVLGINETKEEQDDIYVYEQDGIKIAILNYTYGTNGIALPDNMPYAVDLLEEEKVISDIKRAEQLADFTVVCPHWGTEYVLEQTAEQERWAEIFLENGVDLVIGTHPHVIEPVEMLVDEDTGNKMLVYYSIGNFVNWTSESGSGKADRMVGGMAKVTIGLDEGGNAVIIDYGVTALVSHVSYGVNGVYTVKLSDYTDSLADSSAMIMQDSAFSREYCVELCNKVWGALWD